MCDQVYLQVTVILCSHVIGRGQICELRWVDQVEEECSLVVMNQLKDLFFPLLLMNQHKDLVFQLLFMIINYKYYLLLLFIIIVYYLSWEALLDCQ